MSFKTVSYRPKYHVLGLRSPFSGPETHPHAILRYSCLRLVINFIDKQRPAKDIGSEKESSAATVLLSPQLSPQRANTISGDPEQKKIWRVETWFGSVLH